MSDDIINIDGLIPIPFWFTKKTQMDEIAELDALGKRLNPTKWEKRQRELAIEEDCGCIADDVNNCYDAWSEEKSHLCSEAAQNVINAHFHIEPINEIGERAVLDFLIMNKHFHNVHNIYQSRYLMVKHNMSYDEAMTFISYMDIPRYIEHGSGARYNWITDKGKKYIDLLLSKYHLEESHEKALIHEYILGQGPLNISDSVERPF